MKVSDNAAESAVLGYSKKEDMGVANTPEFLQILSTSLYKYQKLAFVRESIANAWDAHIEAGLLDTPIHVTTEDDIFSVQDHGAGIAPNDMVKVYGTYGQGTKANDGKSTGGFGLGCKSPFAYVDAFEVISCHNNVKTIYQIAKTGGTPSIITIASMPTGETGLTVNIPIKQGDRHELTELAGNITRGGDILCDLNGMVYTGIGLRRKPGEICIILDSDQKIDLPNIREGRHLIRYANMLYPMPSSLVHIVADWLELRRNQQFIVQAEDNSLSVQPSREGLSETEDTLDALTTLLTNVVTRIKKESNEKLKVYQAEMIECGALEMQKTLGINPYNVEFTLPESWNISEPEKKRTYFYLSGWETPYPIISSYDMWVRQRTIVEGLVDIDRLNLRKKGHVTPTASGLDANVCRLYYNRKFKQKKPYKREQPLNKRLVYKLYKKLFITGEHVPEGTLLVHIHSSLEPLKKAYIRDVYGFATRQVILTTTKDMKVVGDDEGIVYHVKRTKKNIALAREFLASTGYTIIDKIEDTVKYKTVRKVPENSVRSLVHPNGLLSYFSAIGGTCTFQGTQALLSEVDIKVLSKPKHIVHMVKKNGVFMSDILLPYRLMLQLQHELHEHIAVSYSKAEHSKWSKDVVPLGDLILIVLQAKWDAIKDEYLASTTNLLRGVNRPLEIIEEFHENPELHDLLPYVPSTGVAQEHRQVVKLIHTFYEDLSYKKEAYLTEKGFSLDMMDNLLKIVEETYSSSSPDMDKLVEQAEYFYRNMGHISIEPSGSTPIDKAIYTAIINQIRNIVL